MPRTHRHVFRGVLLLALLALLAAGPGAGADETPAGDLETVYYDFWDPATGELAGGTALVRRGPDPDPALLPRLPSTTLLDSGRAGNRIDIVFVGDGYTAAEMATYRAQVQEHLGHLFALKPFNTYQEAFNVHRVDVVSAESGIDHDPAYGIYRNTALDGQFWCNNIERLICVDWTKTYAAAASAPDADVIVALVNSTKYGGSGGGITVVAAGTGDATLRQNLLVHEMGHTFADLADEYEDSGTYTGGDPWEPNVSIYTATQMQNQQKKWFRWVGHDQAAYGGLVSTYEGAYYHNFGVYRPTQSSIMRDLSVSYFNPPSIEAIVTGLWTRVNLVDQTPATVKGNATVTLPLVVTRNNIRVTWYLDGTALPGETNATIDLKRYGMGPGRHVLIAVVKDKTPRVRDPQAKNTTLTQRVRYLVTTPNYYCDGRKVTHWGSIWDDSIVGTAGNDVIAGLEGNDEIRGAGGNDFICGGPGDDTLIGGPGHDRLFGEGGYDQLVGGNGNDTLDGGTKGDLLSGGPGNDTMSGSTGNDTATFRQAAAAVQVRLIQQQATGEGTDTLTGIEVLIGSAFADLLTGDGAVNRIVGGNGNDDIRGAGGNDNLLGGDGHDTIKGGDGHDFLRGQQGDDDLDGGGGTNTIAGGPGKDTCSNGPIFTGC